MCPNVVYICADAVNKKEFTLFTLQHNYKYLIITKYFNKFVSYIIFVCLMVK